MDGRKTEKTVTAVKVWEREQDAGGGVESSEGGAKGNATSREQNWAVNKNFLCLPGLPTESREFIWAWLDFLMGTDQWLL